jgi:hypothetical protein
MEKVSKLERGWAGHHICSDKCRFRRNTLLSYKDIKIVVSTVGLYEYEGDFKKFGIGKHGRYFETLAFHADAKDTRYYDADGSRQISFDSQWAISEIDADDKANDMHEAVVKEIKLKLLQGNTF